MTTPLQRKLKFTNKKSFSISDRFLGQICISRLENIFDKQNCNFTFVIIIIFFFTLISYEYTSFQSLYTFENFLCKYFPMSFKTSTKTYGIDKEWGNKILFSIQLRVIKLVLRDK